MKNILILFVSVLFAMGAHAQLTDAIIQPNIKTVQLFPSGNQLGYPVLGLNNADKLELHFDDLDGNVKSYSYTYQLCNADWTPAMLSSFDFIKGFSNQRINTYRISSVAFTRYTHYSAVIPDNNCAPSRSGNYILKVYLNGDTSRVAFTKRFLVVDNQTSITAQIQQPFNAEIFRTWQKIPFQVTLGDRLQVMNHLQQVKVMILQNNRWDNALINVKPTFFSGKKLDYNTEDQIVMPGGKEWRWLDLRSLRFQSDRVAKVNYTNRSTEIFVKPDVDRSQQKFVYYRDINGMYTIETTESINPYWQTDYATVHFTYMPPENVPLTNKDLFLIGALNNYNLNDSAKMVFNNETRVYEKTLFLKQGYYNYNYVTIDQTDPKRAASYDYTEGNYWDTENDYMILVYYRALAGRVDELVGITHVNSLTGRKGIGIQ
ncbi:DUF5103 domain-containing protein [Niastella yeongjuensis]|uniref:DUF5103 domain-containing protein n=1 Tax=Niastella yeongjuensis TaxID=354355 RepID=A0A1V9F2T1_9BACT|nr:DUF5103 domain-containing protein [Niastella yeongjuensis]OQP52555.1 DUF5103 domain-containing protein [Niastella yeongjuensis]SEP34483.1 protein of unknown function [Niastella yeongjuensis]